MPIKPKLQREQAIELAWERGLLSYKLYDYQEQLYQDLWQAINDNNCLKYYLNISRRWGKSTLLCLISFEYAIRFPESQIRFAAPTTKMLRKITLPIYRMLLTDCPEHIRPTFNTMDNVWTFANGSQIHLAGTDKGNAENLRGTASNLNLVDEAGFCDDLYYVLYSILTPQTLTTKGTTLLASSPPKSAAHDSAEIYQECYAKNYAKTYTIYDNFTLDKQTIDLYAEEAGGKESTTFKREYLAQFVVDQESAIIPEWKPSFVQELPEDSNRQYLHNYTAMDLSGGSKDLQAHIYGYYDFPNARLVITHESTLGAGETTTDLIAQEVCSKEREAFGESEVYMRIADNNNLILLRDLNRNHKLQFMPTSKDNLHAMVNQLRNWVKDGRLIVHPRCTQTIANLQHGIWDSNRKQFARTKALGHFDHLAALIYLVRNINQTSNPIPTLYNWNTVGRKVNTRDYENSKKAKELFNTLYKR